MADYCLCGWRLTSDVPLPLLPPWTGSHRKTDIQLRQSMKVVKAKRQERADEAKARSDRAKAASQSE